MSPQATLLPPVLACAILHVLLLIYSNIEVAGHKHTPLLLQWAEFKHMCVCLPPNNCSSLLPGCRFSKDS